MSPPLPPTARVRSGCAGCRSRHLKCDDTKPACARCQKAGIECVRGVNIRFRHDYNPSISAIGEAGPNKRDYDFDQNQRWCRTDRRLNFVDETQDLIETSQGDEEHGTTPTQTNNISRPARNSSSTSDASTTSISTSSNGTANVWDTDASSNTEPLSPLKRRRLLDDENTPTFRHGISNSLSDSIHPMPYDRSQSLPASLPEPEPQLSAELSPFHGNDLFETPANFNSEAFDMPTPSQIFLETPRWPLADFEEAKLMRYWIDNLAHYLDMCDQQRHFAVVVPYRAASCPPLLNAVFATAARHQCRDGRGDPYVADQYHQKCLALLIPLLNDSTSLLDENLLAAAIILRFHEEMEASQTLTESDSHLSGTHIFMKAQERSVAPGGLRQAAFWVGLRMDLFFAFMNSRPVLPSLAIKTIDKSLSTADDCTWANRMVATCSEALQYCFGNDENSLATYDELVKYTEDWMTFTPPSFTPIYYREASGDSVFPEYWVLSDAVGAGLAHYYLTKILLTAHNPKIPRLGPKQRAALNEADEQIKQYVLTICGIAESNPRTPPYSVKACMATTMAGDRFTDRRQQEALLKIMYKGQDLAWPTLPAVKHLKEAWGWKD